MSDLINRADAIEAVHKYFVDKINNEPHEIDEDGDDVFTDMKSVNALFHHNKMVSKAIKALPSADGVHIETYRELYEKYVELKHASADAVQGEWKHTITWQPYCSNCEYVFGEDEEFSPFWNYCPMCGARIKDSEAETILSREECADLWLVGAKVKPEVEITETDMIYVGENYKV